MAVASGGTCCTFRGCWIIACIRLDHLCNNRVVLFVLHDSGECFDEGIDLPTLLWKFEALWEHPLCKGEATCHSSSWHSFMHRRLVENILLVAKETCAL